MNVQEETEKKILEKIKLKMERIKANQKKVQGAIAKDPIHHDAGKIYYLPTNFKILTLQYNFCVPFINISVYLSGSKICVSYIFIGEK